VFLVQLDFRNENCIANIIGLNWKNNRCNNYYFLHIGFKSIQINNLFFTITNHNANQSQSVSMVGFSRDFANSVRLRSGARGDSWAVVVPDPPRAGRLASLDTGRRDMDCTVLQTYERNVLFRGTGKRLQ